MATGTQLIVDALTMIGDKSPGGTLTSAEQTHWLRAFNRMLDAWSIERLMVFNLLEESKALTASDGTYTIGSGGDWNTTRPTRITQAWIRDSSSQDSDVEIIGAEAYNLIVSKTVDGTYPQYLYYDAAMASGLGTIYLYPEPASSLTLYINSWKQFSALAAIGDSVSLPPGYEAAIVSNFAIWASAGQRPVPAEVVKLARDTKAAIKSVNLPDVRMRLDAGLLQSSRVPGTNIFTGP